MKRTGQSKIAVVGWGRGMGHKGHMYLADAVITQAQAMNADPYFFVSKTVGKDDPIFPEEKVRIYQKVFPQHATIFTPEGNLNQALTELATLGYQGVIVVVGADQKQAFQYLEKPNKEGVPVYQSMGLKKLRVISRQETNSKFSNEEGPRATPMREILLDPNSTEEQKFATWRRDMPEQLSDREVLDVMNKAESRLLQLSVPKSATKAQAMSKKQTKLKESLIMDRDARVNAYYVSRKGDKHRVAENIPYYLLDKLVPLLTKKYAITMNDIEVRPADKTQYRRSGLPELAEERYFSGKFEGTERLAMGRVKSHRGQTGNLILYKHNGTNRMYDDALGHDIELVVKDPGTGRIVLSLYSGPDEQKGWELFNEYNISKTRRKKSQPELAEGVQCTPNEVAELLYNAKPEIFTKFGDEFVMNTIEQACEQHQGSAQEVAHAVVDILKQGITEAYDHTAPFNAADFNRHMEQLRAREELRKTDPMKALVGDLIDKDNAARNVKKKPQDDDSMSTSDPRHPQYAYTQAGQHNVDEGSIGDKIKGAAKSIKRAVQWDSGPEMVTPAGTVQAFKNMDGQHLANFVASRKELSTPKKGSARAFADKVIDREMKQRGYGRVADKGEQGVEEGEEEALAYATKAHAGQTRSGGDPYITHPMRVADHIRQYKQSHNLDALISAAYLHDTIEDTDTTQEVLHDLFGGLVASLVKELTSDPEQIKKMGKAQYLSHKMAAMSSYGLVIKLADRLDNVKDITTARTPEWRAKYAKETNQILDYIEKTRALSGTHNKLISLIRAKLAEIDNPPQVADEGISRRGILKGLGAAMAAGAASKASAIAGAFPTPSHQQAMYKAAADSNAAQARADAAEKAKRDAKRLQQGTADVERLNKINYHGGKVSPTNASWDGDSDFLDLDGTKYSMASRMPIKGDEPRDMKLISTREGRQVYIWTRYRMKGDGGHYFYPAPADSSQINEFAPGNGDDGLPYAEYQVYQCNPEDQFEWIGGPLYQTDNMGMAHKYAYEKYVKHRPKAFMVWQERSQGSRGNYGVKGQSDGTENDMTESSDYLDEK